MPVATITGEVRMAKLSDSMEEGVVVRWLVADGDSVRNGQPIVEVETDKATMSQEAESDGVIRILAAEGATAPVGTLIARILDPGAAEAAPEALPPTAAEESPGLVRPAGQQAPPEVAEERIPASPLARRVAASLGVDLHRVTGSGPRGRILKRDVVAHPDAPAGTTPAPAAAPVVAAGAGVVPLTRAQQTIARRMSESKATIPDFFVEMEVDARALLALRAQFKEVEQTPPSLNDCIVKAAALALVAHPGLNASYKNGGVAKHREINIGIAVATEESLLVPVIRDAARLPLPDLGRRARELTARARSGKATAPDLAGGTFTVSNLGMMGVRRFLAIVNPPQAAILSVGATAARPLACADGSVVGAEQMTLGLTCDHRIVYGAAAAAFLTEVRQLLEAPMALLMRSETNSLD